MSAASASSAMVKAISRTLLGRAREGLQEIDALNSELERSRSPRRAGRPAARGAPCRHRAATPSECPSRRAVSAPAATSHSRIVLSQEPEASHPSGSRHRATTPPECPSRRAAAAGRAARLGLLGQHDPAVGCGGWGRDGAPRGAFRLGRRPLPVAGRAARLGLLGQRDPAVGYRGRGRDGAPRRGIPARSPPCACCQTGGSPRAPMTTRSGCGMWRPGPRRRASRGIPARSPPCACCRTGGSPRAPGTTRSGCWMWRLGPRRRASRGIPARSPPSACCRTGGSPRAPGATRSGCGISRPGPTSDTLTGFWQQSRLSRSPRAVPPGQC